MNGKTLLISVLVSLVGWGTPLLAQNAEELMEGVRMGASLQHNDLTGSIQGPGGKTNITLYLRGKDIQLQFLQGETWIPFHMRLGDKQYDLFEFKNGKTLRFPDAKLKESIAGSDLTYEDLSLRFLYWPNPELMGDERVGIHDCWKVRVRNPNQKGAYSTVYIWIHKSYGAFMKVEGYDSQGKRTKFFAVNSVMKLPEGGYFLKELKVSTMNGTRTVSNSTVKLDRPKGPQPQGPR